MCAEADNIAAQRLHKSTYYSSTLGLPLGFLTLPDFYRAMHYSAKRGLEITCRLSVRLSVRL